MQIKLQGASLVEPSERSSAATWLIATFSRGQILSADIVIAHWTAHEPSCRSRHGVAMGSSGMRSN